MLATGGEDDGLERRASVDSLAGWGTSAADDTGIPAADAKLDEKLAAEMPVATTAFKSLAPSMCMIILFSLAKPCIDCNSFKGQTVPPPRLAVCSIAIILEVGECLKSDLIASCA